MPALGLVAAAWLPDSLRVAAAAKGATDALYIGRGLLSDSAQPSAGEHGIAVWQAAELDRALRGLSLGPAAAR